MLLDASAAATSFYDKTPLRSTLEQLVDIDRSPRLSVGAVQVESGNSHDFDSTRERIGSEHIMASGALPPAFPAIEINGRLLLGWWHRLLRTAGMRLEQQTTARQPGAAG